jgi:hypothetical protein
MRLLLVVDSVISAFLFLSLVFFLATRKTYPGFRRWTSGVGILALGYLFLCLREIVPDAVSIFAANLAFPLGMVMLLEGMRRFLGLSPLSKVWYYSVLGVPFLGLVVFYYDWNSPVLRNVVISAAVTVPHWAMAVLIFRQSASHKSMFFTVIGSLFAFGAAVIVARALWSIFEPRFHLLLASPVQFTFFLSLVVLQIGENLCFIMLNSERLESELVEAKTTLSSTVQELERALGEVKTLTGLLPICAHCKNVRDDQGYWRAVEHFIEEHSEAQFSHGICPDCLQKLYPELAAGILQKKP